MGYQKNYDRYVAQLSLYKMIASVSVFCKLLQQRYKNHQPPPPIKLPLSLVASFSNFVISPSHWCIAMQKCTRNRLAVSLKSKTDFLKIPEICVFWLKHDFLPIFFSAKQIFLCTGSVEPKTDYKFALWFRFYN